MSAPSGGELSYVFLDGPWLKRSWGGKVQNVSVLTAIGGAKAAIGRFLR